MKAVVQRVSGASVTVDGVLKGRIDFGLLVYLGVAIEDTLKDADWIAEKIAHLRIFDDAGGNLGPVGPRCGVAEGKMNLSLLDIVNQEYDTVNVLNVNYKNSQVNDSSVNRNETAVNVNSVNQKEIVGNIGVLAVSQFTLLGDARKGRRPSWSKAAAPEKARDLYLYFIDAIREKGLRCECGEFQARMKVSYTNDGPVTILLDSTEAIPK